MELSGANGRPVAVGQLGVIGVVALLRPAVRRRHRRRVSEEEGVFGGGVVLMGGRRGGGGWRDP